MLFNSYFVPSFGNKPKEMVGRDAEINRFIEGLHSPAGSRERAILVLGQRGYGKTVLLLELAEQAKKNGFVVASPTITSKGMLERIVEKIQEEGEEYLKKDSKLSGGNVGFLGFEIGLQFDREEQASKSFIYKLSKLSKALEQKGKGVLILVDEVQASSADLKELIIAYQELVGQGRNLAIVMAGLPGAVSSVLNDHVLTFLNRAVKIELGPLKSGDIEAYYTAAFRKIGIQISNECITAAVNAVEGSPYMMQLLGYYIIKFTDDDGIADKECVEQAVQTAKTVFITDICKTTLAALSATDLKFLKAMAKDDGSSKMADIANRMQVKPDYAQRYKTRLREAGIIVQERRGEVKYAVPYLKDYFQTN